MFRKRLFNKYKITIKKYFDLTYRFPGGGGSEHCRSQNKHGRGSTNRVGKEREFHIIFSAIDNNDVVVVINTIEYVSLEE